jgi:hypothetical protein
MERNMILSCLKKVESDGQKRHAGSQIQGIQGLRKYKAIQDCLRSGAKGNL